MITIIIIIISFHNSLFGHPSTSHQHPSSSFILLCPFFEISQTPISIHVELSLPSFGNKLLSLHVTFTAYDLFSNHLYKIWIDYLVIPFC